MGWLLASSLYKRDRNEERMKSKREKEKAEEDVALLEQENQELQEEKQELQEEIQYLEKQVEEDVAQDVAQLEQQIQELQEKNQYLEKQSRGTRGTQQRWPTRQPGTCRMTIRWFASSMLWGFLFFPAAGCAYPRARVEATRTQGFISRCTLSRTRVRLATR